MKKRCHELAADLASLAANLLPPAEARVVEAHIAGCAECQTRYQETTAWCVALSAAGLTPDPAELTVYRLRSRVRQTILEKHVGQPRTGIFALALGAASLLILSAWLVGRDQRQPLPVPKPVVKATAPAKDDSPLTLLAYERAFNRSDAAFEQLLARKVASQRPPMEEYLRPFSPALAAADNQDNRLP